MKNTALFLATAGVLATAACGKKDGVLPTDFRLKYNKDTIMVTSNVTTDNKNTGTIYITAESADGVHSMELAMSGYKGVKGSFSVDYRGPGGNMTGNTGKYSTGNTVSMARSGVIKITEVSGGLIKGNFTLYYQNDDWVGSFAAPDK